MLAMAIFRTVYTIGWRDLGWSIVLGPLAPLLGGSVAIWRTLKLRKNGSIGSNSFRVLMTFIVFICGLLFCATCWASVSQLLPFLGGRLALAMGNAQVVKGTVHNYTEKSQKQIHVDCFDISDRHSCFDDDADALGFHHTLSNGGGDLHDGISSIIYCRGNLILRIDVFDEWDQYLQNYPNR
ncbi:MAG TPA: hypothetical protein VJX73_04520 [Terracidiphilus sp.]|nr:hypothetical protein [Terracidiphilus sp.]